MRCLYNILFPLFMFLFGCALGEYVFNEESASNQQLSSSNQSSYPVTQGLSCNWLGKNVSGLVSELGEPDMILETVPKGAGYTGPVTAVAYVYLPKPDSSQQCYNTYVVDLQTDKIVRFHCR